MKTFSNKKCAGILNEDKKPLTYAEVSSEICLQQPPIHNQGQLSGFTPDEMGKRIKIQKILREGGETIDLEDADADILLGCINATKWNKLDEDVYTFTEDMRADLTKK